MHSINPGIISRAANPYLFFFFFSFFLFYFWPSSSLLGAGCLERWARDLQHGPQDVTIFSVEVVPDLAAAIERAACGVRQMSAS